MQQPARGQPRQQQGGCISAQARKLHLNQHRLNIQGCCRLQLVLAAAAVCATMHTDMLSRHVQTVKQTRQALAVRSYSCSCSWYWSAAVIVPGDTYLAELAPPDVHDQGGLQQL